MTLLLSLVVSPLMLTAQPAAAAYGDDAVPWHPEQLDEVSVGHRSSCAIASGAAYCWGSNESGLLGNGANADPNMYAYTYTPVPVDTSGVLAGKTLNHISAGWSHVCASDTSGGIYCWGENTYGGLGDGTTTDSLVPVAVDTSGVLAGKTIKDLHVGHLISCALASDDQVYCWGLGEIGQLGNGATSGSTVPVAVDTSGALAGRTVKKLTVSGLHVCVVASDDRAYCWGANDAGQLGDGTTEHRSTPTPVTESGALAGKDIVDITMGYYFTCALTSEGLVYCWGGNDLGALGNGTSAGSVAPQLVDMSGGLAGKVVTSIEAGYRSVCATTADAEVYCWGNFVNVSDIAYTPALRESSGSLQGKQIASISLGSNYGCAVTTDRYVACWGDGLLDNGEVTLTPVYVLSKLPSAVVDGVSFTELDGKKIMTVGGNGFGSYGNSLLKSLVTLNGTPLSFCAENTGLTAQQLIDAYVGQGVDLTGLVTDTPPCYFLIYEGQIGYTYTRAVVWLPDDFDMNAQGAISVNDSSAYTFNAANGGEAPLKPTAYVNGITKPLSQRPVVPSLLTFRGTAAPGATVVVTVHSDPVVCTTVADSNGAWSCTLPTSLPPGEHTVYIRVTNPDNSVENLGPYVVTVAGATITNGTPTAPNTGFRSQRQIDAEAGGMIVVAGVGLLAAFGAGLLLKRRPAR